MNNAGQIIYDEIITPEKAMKLEAVYEERVRLGGIYLDGACQRRREIMESLEIK